MLGDFNLDDMKRDDVSYSNKGKSPVSYKAVNSVKWSFFK